MLDDYWCDRYVLVLSIANNRPHFGPISIAA